MRLHWATIVRHRYQVLLIVLATVAAAGVATWLQRPVYEGETMMRIEEQSSSALGFGLGEVMPGGMGALGGLGGSKIDADILVLRSRTIAEHVVDTLALHVKLTEPRATRASVFRIVDAPRDASTGKFELLREDANSYRLTPVGGTAAPVAIQVGAPFRVGEVTLALAEEVQESAPERITIEVQPFREVVEDLRKEMQILRPDQSAPMITVRYRTGDPGLAAAVPNAATSRFVDYKTASNRTEGRSTMEFLQEQLATYEEQLRSAEGALESFRESAQIINPTAQSEEQVRQVMELQAQRNQLLADRNSLQQLFTRVRSGRGANAAEYRKLAAYPAFFSNGTVQSILQSLIQLENQRADSLLLYQPNGMLIEPYNRRIAELEEQLHQLARNYLDGLEDQLTAVEATLAAYNSQLATIPAREVEFLRRARQQKMMEQVYTLLQTRLKEAEIQAAGEPAKVQVIDPALAPTEPLYPKPLLNLGLAAVLGLVLGVGVALAREANHPAVRSREDIWEATAGAPLLGQIPAPRLYPNGVGRLRSRGAARPAAAMWLDPASPTSDAYRALGTSLTLMRGEGTPQLLVVTSARAEEGNDVGTANLAVAVAQRGVRTLLVDADLRAAPLHRLLDAPSGPGLADVLAGRVAVTEAVRRLSLGETGTELDFLAAGSTTDHGTELLGSGSMRELLAELRASYQLVIFHAASLDAAADAELLGQRTDATVLVARFGVTQKQALQLASARLGQLGIPLLGVILSDAEIVRGGPSLQRLAYT